AKARRTKGCRRSGIDLSRSSRLQDWDRTDAPSYCRVERCQRVPGARGAKGADRQGVPRVGAPEFVECGGWPGTPVITASNLSRKARNTTAGRRLKARCWKARRRICARPTIDG